MRLPQADDRCTFSCTDGIDWGRRAPELARRVKYIWGMTNDVEGQVYAHPLVCGSRQSLGYIAAFRHLNLISDECHSLGRMLRSGVPGYQWKHLAYFTPRTNKFNISANLLVRVVFMGGKPPKPPGSRFARDSGRYGKPGFQRAQRRLGEFGGACPP